MSMTKREMEDIKSAPNGMSRDEKIKYVQWKKKALDGINSKWVNEEEKINKFTDKIIIQNEAHTEKVWKKRNIIDLREVTSHLTYV